ncbi:helix-turn-helix domain-containing protein [Nocardiopsis coralli]|nr:XRE family transcriptional regulator [Nocardiopsis coralli]
MEELSWAQIGERVRDSRASAGMSQQELAARVGAAAGVKLDRTMISKLERGDRRVDALELTHIASELDFPLTHFISPTPEVVSRRSALADQSEVDESRAARDTYRTEAQLSQWLRDVRQLLDLGLLAPRPLMRAARPVADAAAARATAQWLRGELGLGAAEAIESVADVCESAGQFVAVVPLPGDGASLVAGEVAVAVVGRDRDPGRRRSTAAHELGHMVLGDEYSTDLGVHASREERERLIEVFAAEFLLPGEALHPVGDEPTEDHRRQALIRVSATYRVSWGLAVAQLKRHADVGPEEIRRLRTRVPTDVDFRDALGWKPQPDLDRIRVPSGFAGAVVAAEREGRITPARAVQMMRDQVTLADFDEG